MRGPSRTIAASVTTFAGFLVGCRMPAPEDPNQRVLYRDLERHVAVADTTGWGVDRMEIEGMLESALDSTCRVDALDRRALLTWLDAEIARHGGPVEQAWRRNSKDLGAVKDLLEVTRIRMLLARAEQAALDCPFWIETEEPFLGRQVSERRWQLSLGYGGKGIIVAQGDRESLNFGGAGRLLFGRTFPEGNGLYLGLEVGATGAFPEDPNEGGLEFGVDVVTPVLYRHTLVNTFFEIDAGWLGRTTEDDWWSFDHGIHAGVSVGARGMRRSFLFPGAALGVSWERTFLDGADRTTIKFGLRGSIDLDL